MNKHLPILIAFGLGLGLAYFALPEKIKVEKVTEVVYKDKIVKDKEIEVQVKEVIKVVEKEVLVKETKTRRLITKPDGTIIEEEIHETAQQQVERISDEIKARHAREIAKLEQELTDIKRSSKTRSHTNKKRFYLGGGYDPTSDKFAVNFGAGILGPLSVNTVFADGNAYIGLGFSF